MSENFKKDDHCTRFRLVIANWPTRRSKKSQLAFPLYIPYAPEHSPHVITQTVHLPFHVADRGYPGKHRTNRLPVAHVPPSLAQQCMLALLRTNRTDPKFWTRGPWSRLRSRRLNGIRRSRAPHSLLRRIAASSYVPVPSPASASGLWPLPFADRRQEARKSGRQPERQGEGRGRKGGHRTV